MTPALSRLVLPDLTSLTVIMLFKPVAKVIEVVGVVVFREHGDGCHGSIADLVDNAIAVVPNAFSIEIVPARASEVGEMLLRDAAPLDLLLPVVDFVEDALCVVRIVSLNRR
ncbi:hypothetical protein [Halorubrum sp. FL23]|uniref:hypothetical protein n=1 Tax=Halorubrum sp. FL23 TaxID=3458704 RepID=UPI004034037B